MKSIIRILAALALAPAGLFAVNTYNIFSDGTVQFFQPGGSTKITASYSFEVGVFATGTVFNSASAAQVAANFTSFTASTSWVPDFFGDSSNVGAAIVSPSFDEATLYPAGTSGKQLAIWIYDTKTPSATTDWIIVTNPSWIATAQVFGSSVAAADYNVSDAGTVLLYGSSLDLTKGVTALAPSAVPEPSTYAALAGVAVLGLAALRRRRA